MIVVRTVAAYVPVGRVSNVVRKDFFGITDDFITEKIGVRMLARRDGGEDTADLAEKAVRRLEEKTGIVAATADCMVVVTQNPHGDGLPHTAAVLHDRLGGDPAAALFDISHGCAGYIYGLSIVSAFMRENGLRRGILVTCDPYSKIVDDSDKDTALLFGDAATATLLENVGSNSGGWTPSGFRFLSLSGERAALENCNGRLFMNGRQIFSFAATRVPGEVMAVLKDANLNSSDIDQFLFHQGSKFIVDTLTKRIDLPADKVPFEIGEIGNTVSSSLPILLENRLDRADCSRFLMCGFGVGLAIATCILTRNIGVTSDDH